MHCAEAQQLLEEFSFELLHEVQGSRDNTLSVKKLLQLDSAKQKLILRTWINKQMLPVPDAKKMTAIQHTVLAASWDSRPHVSWSGAEIRRHRDDLYALPENDQEKNINSALVFVWDFLQPIALPAIGQLHASLTKGSGIRHDIKQVSIRFREEGARARILNRGNLTLKNLFQEWKIPTWERNRIPLIFLDETLIAAVGYYLDKNYAAKPDELGYEISYK